MDKNGLLTIGKVTGVHGLGGNLKVRSFAESLDTFKKGGQVRVRPDDLSSKISGECRSFTIEKVSPRKKGLLLAFKGVDTREDAEELIGWEILIPRDELPELEEDTWYWEDLYNLEVIDENLGSLGIIERIFPTGANDILVVKDKKTGREALIPMHRHFVKSVDMENKIMGTRLPPGFDQVIDQ
ncbi:ribosome maturation factor RimM [Desulfospira joergensenii]|uniref:ribosome maturation factor RimM n=1 Tax=Desulfospira joergensenii TaxID=53329 RepID=UPI0003B799FF|nr:ribosome maturation factor RimM [Desulfospira joergensenii]